MKSSLVFKQIVILGRFRFIVRTINHLLVNNDTNITLKVHFMKVWTKDVRH